MERAALEDEGFIVEVTYSICGLFFLNLDLRNRLHNDKCVRLALCCPGYLTGNFTIKMLTRMINRFFFKKSYGSFL